MTIDTKNSYIGSTLQHQVQERIRNSNAKNTARVGQKAKKPFNGHTVKQEPVTKSYILRQWEKFSNFMKDIGVRICEVISFDNFVSMLKESKHQAKLVELQYNIATANGYLEKQIAKCALNAYLLDCELGKHFN